MSTETNGKTAHTPRISHMVLRTTCLQEMIDWYTTVFNAKVLFKSDFGAFLTYDDEHHRIALFAIPGVQKKAKNSSGLEHVAFIYPTFADWITTYERLKAFCVRLAEACPEFSPDASPAEWFEPARPWARLAPTPA